MNKQSINRLVGGIIMLGAGVVLMPVLFDGAGLSSRRAIDLDIPLPADTNTASLPIPPLNVPDTRPVSPAPQAVLSNGATPATEPASNQPLDLSEQQRQAAQASVSKSAKPVAWVVQVGSFNSRNNANQMVKKLRGAKLPAFSHDASRGSKTMHRVLVGPYTRQTQANDVKLSIFSRLGIKAFVTNYRPS